MLKDRIFTVSEFNEFIDTLVSQEEVIVEGELSELEINQNKWVFARIKDTDSSVGIFSVVYQISNLAALETGMLVHVHGRPRLYKKTGRFSIWADAIHPKGEGSLAIAFEKLKQKLSKEGLFNLERKRQITQFPERIGLITAKGSRAYSDFLKILGERLSGLTIYFYPVQVQGLNAEKSIVRAFDYLNKTSAAGLNLDLLVLTRGGGNLEDLMAFNSEEVTRAIFASQIPVVCGVGHEDDVSLADLAADVRASTPSNAAEIIVRDRTELEREVNSYVFSIKTYFMNEITILKTEITALSKRLINIITHRDLVLSRLLHKLLRAQNYTLLKAQTDFASLTKLLKALNYDEILARGFSITYKADGDIIKNSKQVRKDDKLLTRLHKGTVQSKATEKQLG